MCLYFSFFEGTQWPNFGFLQLKTNPKSTPDAKMTFFYIVFIFILTNKVERKFSLLLCFEEDFAVWQAISM